MKSDETYADQIMYAVAAIVADGHDTFSRKEIRDRAGIEPASWDRSGSPIFQGMRSDHPGGAPPVGERYRGVFRQVSRGLHTLTSYGRELLKEYGASGQ